ncbi:MAG: type II toxin-antitoxin system mRNA interferase toxin, RelE/StbE family [Candidatus Latescibacterota bacterium]|nr:MAG: type II toxin-antitoxin system mRNA interferase toxin, RelE/StbE family [Candidatus Latescibacterota bacterium]
MRSLIWGSSFKRAYRRLIRSDPAMKSKVAETLKKLVDNPFHPLLRTHKLSGRLKGLWACVVEYDCRVIFQFLDDGDILLIDIGSHDEVY